ncbi:MAG: DUF3656 domain-containing U32 family peptidase [Acidobacteriota bacterium]
MKIPELLAPAGSYEAFLAAIENGADAVYMGGKRFNARQSAANFSEDEMLRALDYAHIRGKRLYVTFNVLLDNNEFDPALEYAFQLQKLGVDALIIQDIGLLSILHKVFPDLRLHASTQMTVHNSDGVRAVQEAGVRRVVLARELSNEEIGLIHQQCPDMELEVFVHGALCYSYSGQCLFSSVVGGRSGNRGSCAQPCRLNYQLNRSKGSKLEGHLISPSDLCLLPELPSLAMSGVESLKIEGRMKRFEYVAVVTRAYRNALDRYQDDPEKWQASEKELGQLAAAFNRNFTVNQWQGKNLDVLSPQRPNNRGVAVGRVIGFENGEAAIKLTEELRLGDGIVIWVSRGQSPAATIGKMTVNGTAAELAEAGQTVKIPLPGRAGSGDRVFRTHDAALFEEALSTIKENRDENRVPVKVEIYAHEGAPLGITIIDDQGNRAFAESSIIIEKARKAAVSEDDLRDKIGRIGNTALKITEWEIDLDPGIMVPFSELNETRRMAVQRLIDMRLQQTHPPEIDRQRFVSIREVVLTTKKNNKAIGHPRLSVRTASVKSAREAFTAGADRVYLSLHGFAEKITPADITNLRESLINKQELFLQVPGIIKPGDSWEWNILSDSDSGMVMVGDLGGLKQAIERGLAVHADYTLNTFNSHAADFLESIGVKGLCLSPELNHYQLDNLLPMAMETEYIVQGQLPLMVSEHCVYGNLDKKCSGKGCRNEITDLQDMKGYSFPAATDRYCRFHVFNSRTTYLIEELDELVASGLDMLRIEAVLDSPLRVGLITSVWRQALDETLADRRPNLIESKEKIQRSAGSELTKLHYFRGVV